MPGIYRLSIKFVSQKFYIVLIVFCISLIVIYSFSNVSKPNSEINGKIIHIKLKNPYDNVETYFAKRSDWNTSNLGSILFKNEIIQTKETKNDKVYKIVVWKYYKWLENRHIYNFDRKRKKDPLQNCTVKNCVFTGNETEIQDSDAIVVHIQHGIFPNITKRNKNQRWIFLNDESPKNAFTMAKRKPSFADLANVFNWSMTYRSDSDVPVPYGRTIPLDTKLLSHVNESVRELVPFWKEKRRDVLVTILISNCKVSRRMNYIKELQKHMSVDIYGRCSIDKKKSCPGHFRSDCKEMEQYLFYLVFENSECHEYLTEKGFYHAYTKGAIPVILGPPISDCERLLPPNSFLHVDNYKDAQDLANHIKYINEDDVSLLEYHHWRKDFQVTNEHGYFRSQSYHYCRVCEALNFNDKAEKIYDEDKIKLFFDPKLSCR